MSMLWMIASWNGTVSQSPGCRRACTSKSNHHPTLSSQRPLLKHLLGAHTTVIKLDTCATDDLAAMAESTRHRQRLLLPLLDGWSAPVAPPYSD